STEIDFIITLPRFQRTHITNNAMGLHFHPTLHARAESGLRLQDVAWKTNS
ncbi:hypothetical protein K438DRAFT_1511715, partial [Mycena galopus ATCC 62051]